MPSESPTEAPTSCRDLPKYVDGNLVSNEECRMPADFVWEVSPFAFPPITKLHILVNLWSLLTNSISISISLYATTGSQEEQLLAIDVPFCG